MFHRRVVKPLSFVLGLKAEQSPTGEAIPPIPAQIAGLRKLADAMHAQQEETRVEIGLIKAELHPNGGGSLRDQTDMNGKATIEVMAKVVDLEKAMERHNEEERLAREEVARVAMKTAAELAELTSQKATDLARKPTE